MKLNDILAVSIFEKKGFLTVSLLIKGISKKRIFLRKAEGLRDWFDGLKVKILTINSIIGRGRGTQSAWIV